MSSPTFVARYADGIIVRMTTHCALDRLDPARGLVLAAAAYRSRTGRSPPAVIAASFVKPFHDETIKGYSRAELEAIEAADCHE